jgi:5'-nucleotidase
MKKIIYIDMDDVLVDFASSFKKIPEDMLNKYPNNKDEIPGIFSLMDPMPGAINAFNELSNFFDVYILSTSPWENESALTDKLKWVKKYLGEKARKRLIFSHHKNLNKGDYLIDDRNANGVDQFKGEHIWFGKPPFEDWESVLKYFKNKNISIGI